MSAHVCTSDDCRICEQTDWEAVTEDRAERRGIGVWAEDMYADWVMGP